jgi:hypothetical protein
MFTNPQKALSVSVAQFYQVTSWCRAYLVLLYCELHCLHGVDFPCGGHLVERNRWQTFTRRWALRPRRSEVGTLSVHLQGL